MGNDDIAGKFDALERVSDFDQRATGVSLRAYEWELALAFDGKTAALTVGKRLGFDAEVIKAAIGVLFGKGLVRAKFVTLEEFARDRAPVEPPKTGAAPRPPAPASPPAMAERPAAPPPKLAFSLKPSSPPIPTLPMPRPPAAWSSGSPPVAPPNVGMPPADASAPSPVDGEAVRFKMKPLVDFIIQQAGGNSLPKLATQLAVYRVFRRVPRDLILANNIRSLNITDESFEVQSKELYEAIVDAIESTFGVKYARN